MNRLLGTRRPLRTIPAGRIFRFCSIVCHGSSGQCRGGFVSDSMWDALCSLRRQASAAGWRCSPIVDLCPDCAPAHIRHAQLVGGIWRMVCSCGDVPPTVARAPLIRIAPLSVVPT